MTTLMSLFRPSEIAEGSSSVIVPHASEVSSIVVWWFLGQIEFARSMSYATRVHMQNDRLADAMLREAAVRQHQEVPCDSLTNQRKYPTHSWRFP